MKVTTQQRYINIWLTLICSAIVFIGIIILLLIQVVFRAFVAGLDAGLIYNNFPLMGDALIPEELYYLSLSLKIFSNPVFIQFIHRITAYIILIFVTIFYCSILRLEITKLSKSVIYITIALLIQIISGMIILIYLVPISFALVHQLGAIFLLSTMFYSYFLLFNAK